MRIAGCIFFLILFGKGTAQDFASLRDSFMFYEYRDTARAGQFLDEYKTKLSFTRDFTFHTEYHLLRGWSLQDRSDFHGAMIHFKEMVRIAKEKGLLQQEADAYGNMANVFDDLSDDVKCMQYHQLSLQICEKILLTAKDSTDIKRALSGKSAAYGNLATLYLEMKQSDKAIAMVKEGMAIDSLIKNYDFLAISFNTLGNIYKGRKEYDKALENIRKSISLRMSLHRNKDGQGVDDGVYQAYHNIGNLYKETGQLDSARFYFQKSYELGNMVSDRYHMIFVHFSFGELEAMGGNYAAAEKHYLKALALAEKLNSLERQFYITKALSEFYESRGNFVKAFEFLSKSNGYRDSLYNSEKMREMGKAEVSYQFKFKSSVDSLNYAKQLGAQEEIRQAEEDAHQAESSRKNMILYGVIFILLVVLFFSVYLVRLYRQKKKANEIISEQKKLTEHHLGIIEDKQKEIVDSINYAKRIQYALLAHEEIMKKYLSDHFVLFKPKDIVSGDFYWFTHISDGVNEYSFLAVCDSTGHGVPGAFMSLLNISFINEAITEKNILDPSGVFNHVRLRLVQNLGIEGQKDGFDGILLRVDHKLKKMSYAAANNAPVMVSDGETRVLPCDKMPVGKGELSESFVAYEIPSDKKGMLYLPTDGYSDQFGGEKGKKLKFANMLKFFVAISNENTGRQSEILNEKFENWKGNLEQLDDVCIIGIRI